MVPRIEYIEWIRGRPEQAAYDLGSSELRAGQPDPGHVLPPILSGFPDPDPEVTLEGQIAAAYGVDEEQVVITAGATHAYVLAVAAVIAGDDGDRVLVELPGYEPLRRTPEMLGAVLDRFRRPHDEEYRLSADRIAGATVEDTALVVATNRHNPSGRLVGRDTLAEAAAAAAESGARLLVDEVYAPYTTSAAEGALGGPTAAGIEGAVLTGSVAKFHGLSGLRIGWVVADRPFVELVERATAYLPVAAEPSIALARRALANRERLDPGAREQLRANYEQLSAFVEDRADVSGRVFDGSPFAFLAHESADGDAVVEAAWERDLLVVPGRFFEDAARFRVCLGGDPAEMAAALDVLGETLDAVRT